MRQLSISIVLVFAALVAGCMPGMMGGMSQPEQQLSGTLRSVRPVGGGAPTGWTLEMGMGGGASGGMGMNLDVSAVEADAVAMDGKKVVITAVQDMQGGGTKWIVRRIGQVSQ